jgi:hypothetical protein
MKLIVLALALAATSAFATETAKKVVTETTESTVTTVKKTACPMVNGKEDCTVKEVKTKVIELKKKL